jgi:hypothetical protein
VDHPTPRCKPVRAGRTTSAHRMTRWREGTPAPPGAAAVAPRAAGSSVPPIRCPPAHTPAPWRAELMGTAALREWAVAQAHPPGPECVPRCPPARGTCAQTPASVSATESSASQLAALPWMALLGTWSAIPAPVSAGPPAAGDG